jgi:hypothetical protein
MKKGGGMKSRIRFQVEAMLAHSLERHRVVIENTPVVIETDDARVVAFLRSRTSQDGG